MAGWSILDDRWPSMNTVSTSLIGRFVKGRWTYQNPNYVEPRGSILDGYSKKELNELTDNQRSMYVYRNVEGKIVAVTSEGEERWAGLIFWVLIDGRPVKLTDAVVMPEGYEPPPERL